MIYVEGSGFHITIQLSSVVYLPSKLVPIILLRVLVVFDMETLAGYYKIDSFFCYIPRRL